MFWNICCYLNDVVDIYLLIEKFVYLLRLVQIVGNKKENKYFFNKRGDSFLCESLGL